MLSATIQVLLGISAIINNINGEINSKDAIVNTLVNRMSAVNGRSDESGAGKVKEVDIQVEDGKGMDDRGVFQPAGYEIKEKFVYQEKKNESPPSKSGPIYPFGLGNVILGGCFGSNYQPGDYCYDFKKANPFLCLNLLDGATFMGVGFDATETYSSESRRKGLLQRTCQEKLLFHDKDVPDNLVAQGIYEYNVHTTSYSSLQSYQKELASQAGIALTSSSFSKEMKTVSAGVGGGFGGFGASVSTSHSRGSEQSQSESSSSSNESGQKGRQEKNVFIAVLEADLLMFEIFQDSVKPNDLRWEFVSEFLSLPKSYYSIGAVVKFQDFIQRWGTHYVKYAKFGGQLKMIKTKEVSKSETFTMFKKRAEHEFQRSMATMSSAQVQAKINSPWVSLEAGYSSSNSQGSSSGREESSEKQELSNSYREDAYGSTTFEIEGGDPAIASAIFDAFTPSFKTDFKNWLESVPDYAKPFGFQLGDIMQLLNFNIQSLFGKECNACFLFNKRNEDAQCSVLAGNLSTNWNCSEIFEKEEALTKQRLSLQRAIEVYMKEGPIPVYDIHIPGGQVDCESDSVQAFGQTTLRPSWEELKSNSSDVRIIFDMKLSIPGVVSANEAIQVKFFHDRWYVVQNDRIRLFDGFLAPVGNEHKLNIRGLIVTYDETSGLLDVKRQDYEASSDLIKNNSNVWIVDRTVARAEYTSQLQVASNRNQEELIHSMPCIYGWSNVHRFNPFDGGRCIRFTASSAGSIYVLLAVIPSDKNTWYYIQITPKGAAIFKALQLQETVTAYGARGQGSDTLYQTYFVCVSAELTRTRVWYGSAQDNEDVGHNVYLSYLDAEDNLDVKFYTFGSGEYPVDIMDISVLSHTFLEFACRGDLMPNDKLLKDNGHVCDKGCHDECDPFFSCLKPNDATTCGKCKNRILVRYPDEVEECVAKCPDSYEESVKDGEVPRCTYMASCPNDFVHFKDTKSCYKLVLSKQSWADARSQCDGFSSSDLITVSSFMELNLLADYILSEEMKYISNNTKKKKVPTATLR